jgi:hypothetical protein
MFPYAYIDDILIYTTSLSEHRTNVQQGLKEQIKIVQLLKPGTCKFHQTEVKY